MQRQDRRNRRARSELDLKGMVQKPTNSASPSRKNSLTRAVDSFNNLRTAAAAVWPDRRHLRPTWKQVRGALLTWGEVWAIVKVLGLLVASPVVAGPALPLLYGLVASPVPAALCACALAWHLHYYFLRSSYTPRLYTGGTKGLLKGRLLSACPALARRVFPPFLWVDEHLQMVPFFATGLMQDGAVKFTREPLQTPDGEELTIDWAGDVEAPPVTARSDLNAHASDLAEPDLPADAPVLLCLHGACCYSSDLPGQGPILAARKRGWRVACFNRRGHSGSLLRIARMNIFGDTRDMHQIVKLIKARYPDAPLMGIGISTGAALLARYLGEQSAKCQLVASACISPCFNIEQCFVGCHEFYQMILRSRIKEFFFWNNIELLKHAPSFHDICSATSLKGLLDAQWSVAGFSSREEYFEASDPTRIISQIKRPCLFVQSRDDPVCTWASFKQTLPIFKGHRYLCLALCKLGSHCPFAEGGFLWPKKSWAEEAVFEYLEYGLSNTSLC